MQEKDFVAYEYATKAVKAKDQTRAIDMYEAFGWEVTAATSTAIDGVTLSLKRDRKLKHRNELSKLERQAEELSEIIRRQQKAKTLGAEIFSYIFGCVSALILGGGMCLTMLIENSIPALIGGIVLGLIGIVFCGLNYIFFRKLAEKKTNELLPIIDDNEEKLANLLEKGNSLLAAETI